MLASSLSAVGPIGAATAESGAVAQAAQSTAIITGVVTSGSGAPIAGAVITLTGAGTYTGTSDRNGDYKIPDVTPGIYTISAAKPGFDSARQPDVTVLAGSNQYSVTLQQPTLTTIQQIGRTSTAYRRSAFNATSAALANVGEEVFSTQGAVQLQRVLDQIPGVAIDHPGTSATNASPGAITFPSIRGGLGFETSSLIDGHPLAVGSFGDYVTTFLNPDVLQNVEVAKGPGATLGQINYAINGAANFRTLDVPTRPIALAKYGADGFGGTFSNFRLGNSVLNNKLQFIFDYAVIGTPGPLNNVPLLTSASTTAGSTTVNVNGSNIYGPTQSPVTLPGAQANPPYGNTNLVFCCLPVTQLYVNKNELAKLRYNFTPSTSLTLSYLGSQTYTDQNGNHVYEYTSNFTPGAAYPTGVVGNGASLYNGGVAQLAQNVFYPYTEYEINNEPIFQAEFRTALGKDNLLLRGYSATIQRLQYQGEVNPFQTAVYPVQLYGSALTCPAPSQTYNATTRTCSGGATPISNSYTGQTATVTQVPSGGVCGSFASGWIATGTPNAGGAACGSAANPYTAFTSYPYYRADEEDRLRGGSLEYDHPFGEGGSVVSLGYDFVYSETLNRDFAGSASIPSIPPGSFETWQTLFVRGQLQLTDRLSATLTNYLNLYRFHASSNPQTIAFGSPSAAPVYVSNNNPAFSDNIVSHMDPRLGLVYRADRDTSVRASLGSAIAPPYLNLLTARTTLPTLNAGGYYTFTLPAGRTIRPETAFGYDLGFDHRFGSDRVGVLSIDVYLNNVFNQFLQANVAGFCAPGNAQTAVATGFAIPANPDGSCATGYLQAYGQQYQNLTNARYEGVEFAFSRDPSFGLGYRVQGSFQRAYPYNVNPCFYSTAGPGRPCNVGTNLGVINNVNFQTNGSGWNAVSNHSEPYAQGYLELHTRGGNDAYLQVSEQLYGHNNSLNVPAFWVAGVAGRLPLFGSSRYTLNAAVDNLFGIYGNAYITPYGGVTVPLVNGNLGYTNANVIGPRNLHAWIEVRL